MLDGWNYVLFSVESILNLLFVPTVFLLFYICITQKNLHVNFRSLLFLTGVGYFVCSIHRLIIVTTRMCCIGQSVTPFVSKMMTMQMIGVNLSLFSWLFVIIERAIATVFLSKYESKCSNCIVAFILCTAAIIVAAFICCAAFFDLIDNFYMFYMGLQIFIILICFVVSILQLSKTSYLQKTTTIDALFEFSIDAALAVIVLFNISAYRKRHNSMMKLANRYQLDENIRCGRYLIPVALNDVIVKVIFVLLLCYSLFFTDIPLGFDTTHLSHAYDILSAYQRVFFGLALTIRSQKLDHLFRRRKKTIKALEKQATAVNNYHADMKEMWS